MGAPSRQLRSVLVTNGVRLSDCGQLLAQPSETRRVLVRWSELLAVVPRRRGG
jgi:hypothetical protein